MLHIKSLYLLLIAFGFSENIANSMALDLLLAEFLQAAAIPDNYIILPSELDWFKLYKAADEKNAILCVEFYDDSFPGCRDTHQYFLQLARRFNNLPFIHVRLSQSNKWPLTRKSLGGVDFVPCILIMAFLPPGKERAKFEGEREIEVAIRRGLIQDIIKEFQQRRNVIKSLEDMLAKEFLKIVIEQEDQKKEKEQEEISRVKALEGEIDRMEKSREEEEMKKERAREALMKRDREILEERRQNRPIILEELKNERDIEGMSVGRLKEIFRRLHSSIIGITEKSELLGKLYEEFPELKLRQRNVYDTYSNSAERPPTFPGTADPNIIVSPLQEEGEIYSLSDKEIERLPTGKLMKYVAKYKLSENGPLNERSDIIQAIKEKRDSVFKSSPAQLRRQDSNVFKIEINQLNGKVLELNDKLLATSTKLAETKLLSTCRLHHFQIIQTQAMHSSISKLTCQHTVRCNKEELPDPSKQYTLKGVFNYFDSILSGHALRVSNEFDILSTLEPHPNIAYHFAIFYDRPTTQIGCSRSDLLDQIALFSITESLPYTIITYLSKNHKNSAVESKDYLNWMKQLISTFSYLAEKNIYLRSIKHENILYDPETKTLKLIGFEAAIQGQTVPFYTDMTSIGDLTSYLPPEILNAIPGPSNYLDYTAHYTWSAGALSYDLACNLSPFTRVDPSQYRDSDIPAINCIYSYGSQSRTNSTPMPPLYSNLVLQMLSFSPLNRPKLEAMVSTIEKALELASH